MKDMRYDPEAYLEKFVNVSQAAKIFGVNRRTIINWIDKGLITAFHAGTNCMYVIPVEQLIMMKRGMANGKKS